MSIFYRIALFPGFLILAACAGLSPDNGSTGPAAPAAVVTRPPAAPFSDSSCGTPAAALHTGRNVESVPDLPEPNAGAAFADPVFGSCLARLTDRMLDLSPEDASTGLKNEYSRVQSFNADGTRILIRSLEAFWYLYDVRTLQPLGPLPLSVEPRWDSEDPDLIYHIDETRLLAYRISTGESRLARDFADDFPDRLLSAVWTRYEGSPSFDTRTWGLMAQDGDWQPIAFLVYDLESDEVVAKRSLPAGMEIDSVTISPLGNYFLAYFDTYCEEGQSGTDAHPCGLMVYDRSLQNGRSLLRIIGHSDTAVDAGGREVLVYQDIDTDAISMLDLETGAVTPLLPIDFSHSPIGLHFSGRGDGLPGWALVSTYSGANPSATWMDDQVFAVELRAGGRVVRLAHTHSIVDEEQEHDYWAEPHASVDHDFKRVIFTSNWGRSGSGEVETYLLALPEGWWLDVP